MVANHSMLMSHVSEKSDLTAICSVMKGEMLASLRDYLPLEMRNPGMPIICARITIYILYMFADTMIFTKSAEYTKPREY